MRCPSCGTDNAPDSRFCGGCGARLGTTGPRVAPTQKISDDAAFPQRQLAPGAAMPVTAPGVAAPRAPVRPITTPPPSAPSMVGARPFAAADASRPIGAAADAYAAMPPMAPAAPPPSARPVTPPPSARPGTAPAVASANARSPRPQLIVVDDPSLSLPIAARRPWGLILVVLLLDVGLAVAGVLLLREGLADRPGRAAPVQRAASPTGST